MKTITLNGITFEVSKKALDISIVCYAGRNLYDCYNNPSNKKIAIWNDWNMYFCELTNPLRSMSKVVTHPFVNSYNNNFFTIGCQFELYGTYYTVKITPTHNYIWII